MTKLICGVGINDADYSISSYDITIGDRGNKKKGKRLWICPFYRVWSSMLHRCYGKRSVVVNSTYYGCTVYGDWHRFSIFKKWMETQEWEGKHLDKDLLVRGNKIYSPETCIFVSMQVNIFLIDRGRHRGKYMIGCYWDKKSCGYRAFCNNPITAKQEHLGIFSTEQEAHDAWLAKKLEHARTLANMQNDDRVSKTLIERYTNYDVEIGY